MDNETDYEGLDKRIVDLIEQYWMEEKRPLLLSQLGSRDGGEVARRAKSMMGSLGVYLRARLSAKVNILQHSTKPTVVGAVPADAGVTEADTDKFLDRTIEPRKTDRRYATITHASCCRPRIWGRQAQLSFAACRKPPLARGMATASRSR